MRTIIFILLSTVLFSQSKTLYVTSTILDLAHGGMVDAKMYSNENVPEWVKSDEVYLGGRVITLSLNLISAYQYAKTTNLLTFSKTTLASLLLGSIAWDLVFGQLLYKNALYPFPNWVTLGSHRIGFQSVSERIFFDLFRLGLAAILLIEGKQDEER